MAADGNKVVLITGWSGRTRQSCSIFCPGENQLEISSRNKPPRKYGSRAVVFTPRGPRQGGQRRNTRLNHAADL